MSSATITCLCGAINTPLSEPLPGKTELCHCNPCRYTTGALFVGWVDSHDSPPGADVLAKCTVYHSSKTHDRYFCSTCGTKTFLNFHHRPDGTECKFWFVFGGAIDPPEGVDKVLNVVTNEWLDDTGDGGMAAFMTKLDGRTLPLHKTDRKSEQLTPDAVENMMKASSSTTSLQPNEMLKAECHCGGVSLRIEQARPDDKSIGLDRFTPKDGDGNPTGKHMAFCCVCRYCRLHSGASLTPWLYIPPSQVINPNTNKPVAQHDEVNTDAGKEANKRLSLKHYQSREDAYRSFCSVCGASVFYSNNRRPEIVNVAAGLLRAEEGIMARRWLSWQWGRTAWKEETTQRDVTDAWRATADLSDLN